MTESDSTSPVLDPGTGETTEEGPVAIGYVRLSQESDRSIDSQKEDICAYCRDRGLSLAGILNEGTHTSGFDSGRSKYQEVRRLVADQTVDIVVVRDLSRLSRDKADRIRLLLDLEESPVELHSVERGKINTTDYSLVVEAAMATADDVGKRKEIERARREVQQRLDAGYYHGRPPFGLTFDSDGRHLVPSEEFNTALQVLALRDDGLSYREIADKTGVNRTTVSRVVNGRDRYENLQTHLSPDDLSQKTASPGNSRPEERP